MRIVTASLRSFFDTEIPDLLNGRLGGTKLCADHGIEIRCIQPGKPNQNVFQEESNVVTASEAREPDVNRDCSNRLLGGIEVR